MGFWGYGGGYPWVNGSAYGYPWMGGASYPGYMPGMPVAGPGPAHGASHGGSHEEAGGEGHEAPHKRGGITGFFQGIAQGAVNTIKGIFSPAGLLMLGGTAALTWLTAGAILPVLGVLGLGVGTYQLCKGIASGDSEKMGEGVFSFGLSTLGFLGPKTVTLGRTKYALSAEGDGLGATLLQRLKAPFGLSKYRKIGSRGQLLTSSSKNLYELSWAKMQQKYAGLHKSMEKQGWGTKNSFGKKPSGGSGTTQTSPQSGNRLNILSTMFGRGAKAQKLTPQQKTLLGGYLKNPTTISSQNAGTVKNIQQLAQQRRNYISAKLKTPTWYLNKIWRKAKYKRELTKLNQLDAEIQKLQPTPTRTTS
jgi:hypothetical protein